MDAMKQARLIDRTMLLAALCTIRAEAAGFAPLDEGRSRFNTSPRGQPFDLYDHRKDLGNQGTPDGERYKGRGFVQLTGRANYATYGQRLKLPLLDDPERANDAPVAAQLLATFLQDRELRIKQALLDNDLASARRLVNGGSHGLDAFSQAWRIGDLLTDEDV